MKRSPRRASPCARHPSTDVSFGQEKGPRPPLAGAPIASGADGGFLMIMERVSPAVAVAARHVVAMADLWEGSQGGFQKTGRDLVLSSRRRSEEHTSELPSLMRLSYA